MPLIDCNDIQLYYETRGPWPARHTPLLCIPGLGNDCTRWERCLVHLEKELPLVIPDNRGVGRSDSPAPPYNAELMAADAAALLDHLHLERVHVLGHSMGGFIAQALALSRPELVAGLVLASTAPVLSSRNKQLFALWLEGLRQDIDPEWITRDIFFWMYPQSCFEEPEAMNQLVREALEGPYVQPLQGLEGQIAACDSFDGRAVLAGIRSPTLVLHGALDMLIPLEEAESMSRGLPRSTLQVMEGAGHLPHQQLPAEFAKHILNFLNSLQA